MAKERGVAEGVIREAMAAVTATNGGLPRAEAREALQGLLNPLPAGPTTGGYCHD